MIVANKSCRRGRENVNGEKSADKSTHTTLEENITL